MGTAYTWLESAARRELLGCRVRAYDGTVLFTPDGQGSYGALWTRDFAYMVQGAIDLIEPEDVRAAIAYLLHGQRADGCMPDRVQANGLPVYSAGPANAPLGAPPTDNAQFMVSLVYHYVRHTGDLAFGRESLGALRRGLDLTPRSERGLVYIPPGQRQSPYGFTDTIAKTGELLFSSLLYWTACKEMAALCEMCGVPATTHAQRAAEVEGVLDRLWDAGAGAYRAATTDCNQVDVWGTAFAVYSGFAQGARRQHTLAFLHDRYDECVWRGQVRHLLQGEYWQRTLIPVLPETYQNGAYWATASGWMLYALAEIDLSLARSMLADLLRDFQQAGICECVNEGYRKLEHYVVSAVNPLGALARLPRLGEMSFDG